LSAIGEDGVKYRREFTLSLREQLTRFRFAIQAARTEFWEVDYSCYPQARASVQMLRATPGCEVYVVTEGHEETQLKKLKCAGLSDLFPRGRVLSTSAASDAEEARSDLLRLLQSNRQVRNELRKVEALVGEEVSVLLDPLLKTFDAAIGSITFLADLLSVLGSKAHKKFYSAVIEAIRLNPESPAQVLQSFLQRRKGAVDPRPMKFFMIGDRYDNDCEPLLEMNLSTVDKVGVGTCRLLSGKRSRAFCPPKSRPPTMFVCDTLAQVAHILHTTAAWEHIALLRDITPPVLLEPKDGVIFYGPARADRKNKPEELALRFKDLSWARTDEILRKEQAVREMLDQIERDLAACDLPSLSRLFHLVRNDIADWWQIANERKVARLSQEPAASLLKGALRILAGVNWWRYLLRRPLLGEPVGEVDEKLEWTLGSYILRSSGKPRLNTNRGMLQWAAGRSPDAIKPADVLDALPFSHEGIAIVTALERDQPQFEDRRVVRWLEMARSLPRSGHQ
jgi:FMN phosphatase YigB (HAD superfamily)